MAVRKMVLTALVTATVCILAWVAIPLPFLYVPFTAQLIGVLIAGPILGPHHGALSMCLYLCLGCLGFPVFAGGASGFGVLLGPTAGFLFGFIVAAYVTGITTLKLKPETRFQFMVAIVPGLFVVLACGAIWPILGMGVPPRQALTGWAAPFVIPGLVKVFMAAELVKALRANLPLDAPSAPQRDPSDRP